MPAHVHRQKQSGAVTRLTSSRLPAGTPQPPGRSPNNSRATNRSISAGSSHIITSSYSVPGHLGCDDRDITIPAHPTMSTAEAKLQRQNERIQLAEAALANPPQPIHSRPQSRAKTRTMKSSGDSIYSGRSRATSISDGGVAIETRVNSYRSEGSRPPRPYTSSARDASTVTTAGAVGMERQDSVMNDAGFQTYTGRRNSRRGELGAYEDKPAVKQTTVEATVDQREILAVFGNPLPGLEFLAGQAGWRNGQVQFIQHPNGDVSAHMWSLRSYQWDNVGQFSNIRKKIEGQLAGDQLKGETALQKLQQNSLAYFRTIAKQREAASTGMDFGQVEIQQLLPDPTKDKISASSNKKFNAPTPSFSHAAQHPQVAAQEGPESDTSQQQRIVTRPSEPADTLSFVAIPQDSRAVDDQIQVPSNPKQLRVAEDPFTANAIPHSFSRRGPEYNGGTVAGPARQTASMAPPQSIDPRYSAYGLYNQIPLPAVPDIRMPCKPLPGSRTFSSEGVGRSFGSNLYPQSSVLGMPAFLPARVAGTRPEVDPRHLSIASTESLRGKPVSPLPGREALRENLFKMSGHAVERSLSRENLQNLSAAAVGGEQNQPPRRTVLHDPFQSDCKVGSSSYSSASASRRTESEDHSSGVQRAPRTVFYHNTGMPIYWEDSQPTKNAPALIETHLTNSVPDIVDDQYSIHANRSYSTAYDFNSDPRTSYSMHSSEKGYSEGSEQQLKDWWTSGDKFARHEQFYQRIQALSKLNVSSEVGMARTSTVANPLRPVVTKPSNSTNSDILARVLIPVYENLASYKKGPTPGERPNYWSPRWSQAPEWCIDRGPNGNKSFFDDPGQSSSRFSRGSRYSSMGSDARFPGVAVPASLERRLRDTQF